MRTRKIILGDYCCDARSAVMVIYSYIKEIEDRMHIKRNKKGFTLAELLIVVAIIGVLVAISIPIFSGQLEKAREATDAANIRSQYAEVMTEAITEGGDVNGKDLFGAVELKQKKDYWQSSGLKENLEGAYGTNIVGEYLKAGGTAWVEYKGDQVILHYEGGSENSGNTGGGNTGGGNIGGGTTGGSTGSGSTGGGTGGGEASSSDSKLPEAFKSVAKDWNEIVEENPRYTIEPGKVYIFKGSIYFGTRAELVQNDMYNHHDPQEIVGWYAMEKPTGKIWDQSDFSNKRYDVSRGDLCKVDNDYYVFNDGGNATFGPLNESRQWVKINLNQ